jgi:chromosome segregation ATPase
MSRPLIRRLPEEEELLRKLEELAAIRDTLAERELELVDFRSQLAAFEGRYLREVGSLYAELDEWNARLAELRAQLNPTAASKEQADEAHRQARQTYADAHGEGSEAQEFTPTDELKKTYREAAKRMHPDFAADAADLERRTRSMAAANSAYKSGDAEALRRILDEYEASAEAIRGEGIGAELVRIIRQISSAKSRLAAIERELAALSETEIALLKKQSEEMKDQGRNLLAELATAVRQQIELAKRSYESLAKETRPA